jgi:hypothetical protein
MAAVANRRKDDLAEHRTAERRHPFTFKSLTSANSLCRRQHPRRSEDRFHYYADSYGLDILIPVMGILLLSVVDGMLTLKLLQQGAVEINQFMAWLIGIDLRLFATVKMALTGACLVFLVMHSRFRLFRTLRVTHLIYASLQIYVLLIAYELGLLTAL